MTRPIDTLKEQVEQLSLERQLARLQSGARRRERARRYQTVERPYSTLDAIESELPEVVDPAYWSAPETGYAPFTRRDQYGNFAPIIRSETDLRLLRDSSRMLWASNVYLAGLKDDLQNYAIGTGSIVNVTTKTGASDALIDRAQDFVNELLEVNQWLGIMDREFFFRSIEDGESNLRLHPQPDDHLSLFRFVEPEYLTRPRDQQALEAWLAAAYDIDIPLGAPERGPVYDWSYGIQSPRNDVQTHLGYFILWAEGEDWDYCPAEEFVRLKRNTPLTVKPGLPDTYSLGPISSRTLKLLRSMLAGASKQAKIALITQYETEATSSGAAVGDMLRQTATRMQQDRRLTGEWQADNYDDAHHYHAPQGRVVSAGPMGSGTVSQGYEIVLQAALRALGRRWSCPEYMMSGDASNSNFASTMVAESPFVKNMQACQYLHGVKVREIVMKSLRHAHAIGYFAGVDGATKDWTEFKKQLSIDTDGPPIETRDKKAETERRAILKASGIISDETFAAEEGYDYAEELMKGGSTGGAPQVIDPATGQPFQTNPAGGNPGSGDDAVPGEGGQMPVAQGSAPAPPAGPSRSGPGAQAVQGMSPAGRGIPAGAGSGQQPLSPQNPGDLNVNDVVNLNGAQITSAIEVVLAVNNNTLPESAGRELLAGIGFKPDAVNRVFSERAKVIVDPNGTRPPAQQPGQTPADGAGRDDEEAPPAKPKSKKSKDGEESQVADIMQKVLFRIDEMIDTPMHTPHTEGAE